MPKFRVYEVATVSYFVGEYEAESKEEAEQMADDDPQYEQPMLCHHCASEVNLGEWYAFEVDEI